MNWIFTWIFTEYSLNIDYSLSRAKITKIGEETAFHSTGLAGNFFLVQKQIEFPQPAEKRLKRAICIRYRSIAYKLIQLSF